MGLFGGKKKSGDVRILSEKEIQEKLYGSYRTAHRVVGEIPPAPRPQESKELFSASSATLVTPPAENFVPDISQPIEKEIEKADSSLPFSRPAKLEKTSKTTTPSSFKTNFSQSQQGFRSGASEVKKGLALSGAASSLGQGVLKILFTVLNGIVAILRSINWRVFGNKTFLSWAGIIIVLGLVFGGIHYLNVMRETAIKNPPKKIISAPVSVTTQASVPNVQETKSQSATTKQSKESPISKPTEAQTPGTQLASGDGRFVIQIATYLNQADADRVADKLEKESASPAFSKELGRSGAKTYYGVFIGRFKDYKEAQQALAKFQKKASAKTFTDAFIRTLNN